MTNTNFKVFFLLFKYIHTELALRLCPVLLYTTQQRDLLAISSAIDR